MLSLKASPFIPRWGSTSRSLFGAPPNSRFAFAIVHDPTETPQNGLFIFLWEQKDF